MATKTNTETEMPRARRKNGKKRRQRAGSAISDSDLSLASKPYGSDEYSNQIIGCDLTAFQPESELFEDIRDESQLNAAGGKSVLRTQGKERSYGNGIMYEKDLKNEDECVFSSMEEQGKFNHIDSTRKYHSSRNASSDTTATAARDSGISYASSSQHSNDLLSVEADDNSEVSDHDHYFRQCDKSHPLAGPIIPPPPPSSPPPYSPAKSSSSTKNRKGRKKEKDSGGNKVNNGLATPPETGRSNNEAEKSCESGSFCLLSSHLQSGSQQMEQLPTNTSERIATCEILDEDVVDNCNCISNDKEGNVASSCDTSIDQVTKELSANKLDQHVTLPSDQEARIVLQTISSKPDLTPRQTEGNCNQNSESIVVSTLDSSPSGEEDSARKSKVLPLIPPRTPTRIKVSEFVSQSVSPLSCKMAEKIAIASSRADQKLNDLMLSLSESRSAENDNIRFDRESPISKDGELVRGAFTTLSNSTKACVSPTEDFVGDDEDEKLPIPKLDLATLSRRFESELSAAVEVQLSPRPHNIDFVSSLPSLSDLIEWTNLILNDNKTESAKNNNHSVIDKESSSDDCFLEELKELLNHRDSINKFCLYISKNVGDGSIHIDHDNNIKENPTYRKCETLEDAAVSLLRKTDKLQIFHISTSDEFTTSKEVMSESFAAFVNKVAHLTGVKSPIQVSNVGDSVAGPSCDGEKNPECRLEQKECLRQKVFGSDDHNFVQIITFFYKVTNLNMLKDSSETPPKAEHEITYEQNSFEGICMTPRVSMPGIKTVDCLTEKRNNRSTIAVPAVLDPEYLPVPDFSRAMYYKTPETSPCPFEISVWNVPSIVLIMLGCLGDPVTVCRVKMVNKFCNRIIGENEYVIMKDSVRLGGIAVHARPAFWMWITLEKCPLLGEETNYVKDQSSVTNRSTDEIHQTPTDNSLSSFQQLEQKGRKSKWHHIITRDVIRAFGNLPPHKTKGSRRNSIVRALMTWGQNHLLRRDRDGTCRVVAASCPSENPIRRLTITPPIGLKDRLLDESAHSETVSDWGAVSPVGSNISSAGSLTRTNSLDGVICGNELTPEMKADLQKKLETILDVIAAVHEGFGYCQGMDYVVAHLLRVLQETIEWNAPQDRLPSSIQSAQAWKKTKKVPIHETEIVEETVFQVMNTFLCTYNLRHMYWPELRCLKTCCRVFERLIEKKLPVLADHFDHHDLNIGLFALGWFQTMYLYIPSMPSKTINRMWDIWLVERSMKIFFRVGTAILFLSQPILLNHEIEGMMQYLNTFPDATIFSADILISCALQIKITNSMLEDIEMTVMRENELAHGLYDESKTRRMKSLLD